VATIVGGLPGHFGHVTERMVLVRIGLAQSTDSTIGWMVAKAGPASASINAMTNATVTIEMMRFISATSF